MNKYELALVLSPALDDEGRASFESNSSRGDYAPVAPAPAAPKQTSGGADGFYPIDESIEDDDLPF